MERFRSSRLDETDVTGNDWRLCLTEEHAPRNRYMNVSPYLANRVRLEVPDGRDDYINASPIVLRTTKSDMRLRYIATQGPTATTWPHLWRMIWKETYDPAVIVMLTQLTEVGREKCYAYYPTTEGQTLCANEHDEYDDGATYQLSLKKLESDSETRTQVSKIELTTTEESRTIWHLRFEGWPDFSVPEGPDETALARLIKLSREKNRQSSDSPRIVHDSAGIGRTGTFIALDWLLQELDENALDELSDGQDPIITVVRKLREQRAGMVQSKEQFLFLYRVMRQRWRERWVALNPAEATRLGVPSTPTDSEPASKRQKSSPGLFGQDSLQSTKYWNDLPSTHYTQTESDDARRALEAELIAADMSYEGGKT